MNTNLTKLSLKLDPPAGKAPDGETPLVRALNLTEAVSSCWQASVEVISEKLKTDEELDDLRGCGAHLCIEYNEEYAPDEQSALKVHALKRYLHGQVSDVTRLRRISMQNAQGKVSYLYRYTVTSALAGLAQTRHCRHFVTLKASECFAKLLGDSLSCEMREADKLNRYFGDNLVLQQCGESDYDFLSRVSVLYGLNFTEYHEQKDGGKARLCLSRSYDLAPARAVAGDALPGQGGSRSTLATNPFANATNSDAQAGQMDDLSSASNRDAAITFRLYKDSDNLKLTELSSSSVRAGRQELRLKELAALGTFFPRMRNADTKPQMLDTRQLRENLEHRLKPHRVYALRCAQPACYGGRIMAVDDYYEDQQLKLLVVSTTLKAVLELYKAGTLEQGHQEQATLTVEGHAVPVTGENPGSFADPACFDAEIAGASRLISATVSDGAGRVSGYWDSANTEPRAGSLCLFSGDNTDNPALFYAALDSSEEHQEGKEGGVVVAELTLAMDTAGKSGSGFPLIGRRVLLYRSGARYFLHSYLPDETAGVSFDSRARLRELSSALLNRSTKRPARVHVWNSAGGSHLVWGINATSGDKTATAVISSPDAVTELRSSLREELAALMRDGDAGAKLFVQRYCQYACEDAPLVKFEKVKIGGVSCADYAKKARAQYLKDMKAFNDALTKQRGLLTQYGSVTDYNDSRFDFTSDVSQPSACEQALLDAADEILETCGIEEGSGDLGRTFSVSNRDGEPLNLVLSTSNGAVSIEASSISLRSSGDLTMCAGGKLVMRAEKSFSLSTPNATIEGGVSGLKMEAHLAYCGESPLWTGSSLALDTFGGASIDADSISLSVDSGFELSDTLGASFEMRRGTLSGSAMGVDFSTMNRLDLTKNLVAYDADRVKKLMDVITQASREDQETFEAYGTATTNFVGSTYAIWDYIDKLVKTHETIHKPNKKPVEKFIAVCDVMVATYNLALKITGILKNAEGATQDRLERSGSEKTYKLTALSDKAETGLWKGRSLQDQLKFLGQCFKQTVNITAANTLITVHWANAGLLDSPSGISLSASELGLSADKVEIAGGRVDTAASFAEAAGSLADGATQAVVGGVVGAGVTLVGNLVGGLAGSQSEESSDSGETFTSTSA